MEWRSLLVAICIYLSICFQQTTSRIEITDIGSMMERRPAIWIHIIYVGVAIFDNWLQCLLFVATFWKNCLVDGSFSENALSIINFAATVDQVLNVSLVSFTSCFVKILENVPREFVLAHIQRSFNECGWLRFGSFLNQQPRCFKITEKACNVKGWLVVDILLI